MLRLVRRPGLYRIAVVVAAIAFVSQVVLVVFGFACLFSFSDLRHGVHLGLSPSWHSMAFALPAAMLAPPVNVLRLRLHPAGLASRIVNLRDWRAHVLARLNRQVDSSGDPILVASLAPHSPKQ